MLSFNEHREINPKVQELQEKLLVVGQGKRNGQVIFLAGGAGCFAGNTLVNTENGHKKIHEIRPGEKVWTFNEETGERELCEVEELRKFENFPEELLELTFENGETVVCTEDHEFWVDGRWVQAKDL